MPLNIETVKTDLYDWAVANIPISVPVIFYYPNAPRPDIPYVSLFLLNFLQIGDDWHSSPDNIGSSNVIGDREMTLTVNCYGGDPFTVLENLRSSLQNQSVLDTLRDNGIVFVQQLPINDISSLLDTEFESRAAMDILFRIAQDNESDDGLIETVELTETFSDGESIVYTDTVTIPPAP